MPSAPSGEVQTRVFHGLSLLPHSVYGDGAKC